MLLGGGTSIHSCTSLTMAALTMAGCARVPRRGDTRKCSKRRGAAALPGTHAHALLRQAAGMLPRWPTLWRTAALWMSAQQLQPRALASSTRSAWPCTTAAPQARTRWSRRPRGDIRPPSSSCTRIMLCGIRAARLPLHGGATCELCASSGKRAASGTRPPWLRPRVLRGTCMPSGGSSRPAPPPWTPRHWTRFRPCAPCQRLLPPGCASKVTRRTRSSHLASDTAGGWSRPRLRVGVVVGH
mmetsp:Transcript_27556/g.74184  ORF Transcript_27556/g.74184 Transcript_27556/m.74184 type:complete len:242 (-) Transcript_27556:68-793(-)